jgi:hydroxypyruvate isomerase
MPKFAANLTMMFNEVPFLERFAAAARAGFEAVEFLSPYDHPPEEVAPRLRAAELKTRVLDEVGYDGWVGCECRPARGTADGLGWFAPYRRRVTAEEVFDAA